MAAGSRMREMRSSGSERGQGTTVVGQGGVNTGWRASLTNTRGASGGSPARPAKKRGSTRRPPATRGPALLALTRSAKAGGAALAAQPSVGPIWLSGMKRRGLVCDGHGSLDLGRAQVG